MNFPLIESLNALSNELDVIARNITESVSIDASQQPFVESADVVLGTLAAKLKAGSLQGAECDEYAQLYAALSLLAQDTVRQAYNMDISTPAGKQKFANVVQSTGDNQNVTTQVKRVATVNGQSHYQQILKDLQNFNNMEPQQQQAYINSINKLRIGYERAKNSMGAKTPAVSTNSQTATASTSGVTDNAPVQSNTASASTPSTTFA
jgi:hypothetical protein